MIKFSKPKLPGFQRLNYLKNRIVSNIISHKILIISSVSLIVFFALVIAYRGYLLSKIKPVQTGTSNQGYYSSSDNSASSEGALKGVLNNSSSADTGSNDNDNTLPMSSPFPTFAPVPTLVPTVADDSTTETTTTDTSGSGSSNCNTGSGVPNSWYSDVYPDPPISTNNGSVALTVTIRDCNENTAPVSDKLNISLNSGDPNTQINGNSLPYSVTTQNGQANFTVTSQVAGTVVLNIQDATGSFAVTDVNNNNPAITFSTNNGSGNSSCSTAAGTPNSWYSDVYPVSPVSSTVGSTVTFIVDIRDCTKTNVSSDNITFSQTSNDSGLTVNGSAAPVSVQAQNGEAVFTVTSQNAGTDTFDIQDTTSSFAITDTNNNSPSIIFNSTSTPTPIPTSLSLSCNASPLSLPADGNTSTQVTLQLKDENGNALANQSSVNVSSSDSSNSISGNPFTTDGNGNVSFSITSTNPGQPTFTVSENGNSATTSCVTFTQVSAATSTPIPTATPAPVTPTPTVTITSTPTLSPSH